MWFILNHVFVVLSHDTLFYAIFKNLWLIVSANNKLKKSLQWVQFSRILVDHLLPTHYFLGLPALFCLPFHQRAAKHLEKSDILDVNRSTAVSGVLCFRFFISVSDHRFFFLILFSVPTQTDFRLLIYLYLVFVILVCWLISWWGSAVWLFWT